MGLARLERATYCLGEKGATSAIGVPDMQILQKQYFSLPPNFTESP